MSQLVKILTASDLHRSKRLYDELGRAVMMHKPNVLALVGDALHAEGTTPEQYSTGYALPAQPDEDLRISVGPVNTSRPR